MKALTVYQPWASLIMIGAKPYEFRGHDRFKNTAGQRIAIHASAKVIPEGEIFDLIGRLDRGDLDTGLLPNIALPFLRGIIIKPSSIIRSAILGTAILGTPVSAYEIMHEFGMTVNDSDRDEHANFAYPMRSIQRWDIPEPRRGAQGLWNY